jgi:AraC family transcriptional regulator
MARHFFDEGIAQAIASHLARNYAETITEWMAEHVAEDLNLGRLAAQAGLSKFHFHRLFKGATGVSPAHYQNLRTNLARQLLRETKKSMMDVALDVGYTNPRHFAQLFR